MQNTTYKIVMSEGQNIIINTDELLKVLTAIYKGHNVVCKNGAFNPSFFVSLTLAGLIGENTANYDEETGIFPKEILQQSRGEKTE